jgi:hypothetical protein
MFCRGVGAMRIDAANLIAAQLALRPPPTRAVALPPSGAATAFESLSFPEVQPAKVTPAPAPVTPRPPASPLRPGPIMRPGSHLDIKI